MIAHGSIVSPVSLANVATWIFTDAQPGTGPRVAVKDLIDMAGLPTTAGSRPVADRAAPAERDAACIAGLRAAMDAGHARFVGKTNLHELAYGITGINAAFGTRSTRLTRAGCRAARRAARPWRSPRARRTSPTGPTPAGPSASPPPAAGSPA